jgi:hypothetical protein
MYTFDLSSFNDTILTINKKKTKLVLNFNTGKKMELDFPKEEKSVRTWITKSKKRVIMIKKVHCVQKQQGDILQAIQHGETKKLLETDFISSDIHEETLLNTAMKMVEKNKKNATTNLGIVLSQILQKNFPQLKKQHETNLKNVVTKSVILTYKHSKGFKLFFVRLMTKTLVKKHFEKLFIRKQFLIYCKKTNFLKGLLREEKEELFDKYWDNNRIDIRYNIGNRKEVLQKLEERHNIGKKRKIEKKEYVGWSESQIEFFNTIWGPLLDITKYLELGDVLSFYVVSKKLAIQKSVATYLSNVDLTNKQIEKYFSTNPKQWLLQQFNKFQVEKNNLYLKARSFVYSVDKDYDELFYDLVTVYNVPLSSDNFWVIKKVFETSQTKKTKKIQKVLSNMINPEIYNKFEEPSKKLYVSYLIHKGKLELLKTLNRKFDISILEESHADIFVYIWVKMNRPALNNINTSVETLYYLFEKDILTSDEEKNLDYEEIMLQTKDVDLWEQILKKIYTKPYGINLPQKIFEKLTKENYTSLWPFKLPLLSSIIKNYKFNTNSYKKALVTIIKTDYLTNSYVLFKVLYNGSNIKSIPVDMLNKIFEYYSINTYNFLILKDFLPKTYNYRKMFLDFMKNEKYGRFGKYGVYKKSFVIITFFIKNPYARKMLTVDDIYKVFLILADIMKKKYDSTFGYKGTTIMFVDDIINSLYEKIDNTPIDIILTDLENIILVVNDKQLSKLLKIPWFLKTILDNEISDTENIMVNRGEHKKIDLLMKIGKVPVFDVASGKGYIDMIKVFFKNTKFLNARNEYIKIIQKMNLKKSYKYIKKIKNVEKDYILYTIRTKWYESIPGKNIILFLKKWGIQLDAVNKDDIFKFVKNHGVDVLKILYTDKRINWKKIHKDLLVFAFVSKDIDSFFFMFDKYLDDNTEILFNFYLYRVTYKLDLLYTQYDDFKLKFIKKILTYDYKIYTNYFYVRDMFSSYQDKLNLYENILYNSRNIYSIEKILKFQKIKRGFVEFLKEESHEDIVDWLRDNIGSTKVGIIFKHYALFDVKIGSEEGNEIDEIFKEDHDISYINLTINHQILSEEWIMWLFDIVTDIDYSLESLWKKYKRILTTKKDTIFQKLFSKDVVYIVDHVKFLLGKELRPSKEIINVFLKSKNKHIVDVLRLLYDSKVEVPVEKTWYKNVLNHIIIKDSLDMFNKIVLENDKKKLLGDLITDIKFGIANGIIKKYGFGEKEKLLLFKNMRYAYNIKESLDNYFKDVYSNYDCCMEDEWLNVVYILIKSFSSKNFLQKLQFVININYEEIVTTLIHEAIRYKDIKKLKFLLNAEFYNIKKSKKLYTPYPVYHVNVNYDNGIFIIKAIEAKNLEIVKILWEKGANMGIEDNSPIIKAVTLKQVDIVKFLVGIDNVDPIKALSIALKKKNKEIIKILLTDEEALQIIQQEDTWLDLSIHFSMVKFLVDKYNAKFTKKKIKKLQKDGRLNGAAYLIEKVDDKIEMDVYDFSFFFVKKE